MPTYRAYLIDRDNRVSSNRPEEADHAKIPERSTGAAVLPDIFVQGET
jgi:hypothetical protein